MVMKKAKRVLCVVLAALMLLTSAPLAGFVGMELPELPDLSFTQKAEAAVGLSEYNGYAAAEWAKAHLGDYESVLFGANYWYTGGDCANFVSQSLYMGGMDLDDLWNLSGYLHWGSYRGSDYDGSFIRCQQLYNYLVRHGAQVIQNPSASQASIGDVFLFSASGASRMTHSAIVIDIKDGAPVLAAHSVDRIAYRTDDPYREWHLGFAPERTYLMKLNGGTCVVENPQVFDVYVATGSNAVLYSSASTSSTPLTKFLNGSSPDYAHVYSKTSDGKWGYTFRYGKWGWVQLSQFRYLSHQETPKVGHLFGNWVTVQVADCLHDGIDKRTCTRCGFEETTTTTKGGHVPGAAADCYNPCICTVCNTVLTPALDHDYSTSKITKDPTCTDQGVRTYFCSRNSEHTETEEIAALGHNYEPSGTAPTCTAHGETLEKCTRCGDHHVVNSTSYWTGWTTDTSLYNQVPSTNRLSKTQYSYRDKSTTTSTSSSLSGWILRTDVTNPTVSYGSWSSWSEWQDSAVSNSDTREVETRIVEVSPEVKSYTYRGYRSYDCYQMSSSGKWTHFCKTCAVAQGGSWSEYTYTQSYPATQISLNQRCGHAGSFPVYYKCADNWAYYYETVNVTPAVTKTQYRYRTRTKTTTYYFYKWSSWSAWQDSAVSKTDTREVQTRIVYNYNLEKLGHNWTSSDTREYLVTNQKVTDRNADCYYIGKICTRCKLIDKGSEIVKHSFTTAAVGGSGWEKEETAEKIIWRTYCKNGCGCWLEHEIDKCKYAETPVDPTCTEEGYTIFTCIIHGETYKDDFVPALGHDMIKHDAVTATCTEKGNTEYYYCQRCQLYFADENGNTPVAVDSWIVDEKGHADAETLAWVVETPASCGKTGYMKKYCNHDFDGDGVLCGAELDSAEIPALPAQYYVVADKSTNVVCVGDADLVIEDMADADLLAEQWKAASCISDTKLYVTCKRCENTPDAHGFVHDGSTYSYIFLEPAEHAPVERVEYNPDYCHEWGYVEEVCGTCGVQLSYTLIEPKDHDFETIKEDGKCIYEKCTVCGLIEAGEHDFQRDPARDVAPTCTHEGNEAYTCTKCGDTNDKTVEIIPHDYQRDADRDIAPDCTQEGKEAWSCTMCAKPDDRTIAPLGHDPLKTDAKEPLCEEDGNYEYFVCQRENCGKVFFDKECYKETTLAYTVLPMLGHDMGKWYENGDETHTRECLRTNGCTYTETEDCQFGEWVCTLEPTCTEIGREERVCTVCEYIAHRDVDALDHLWDEGVIDPVSTCDFYGTITYTCQRDSSHTYTDVVPLDPDNHVGTTYTINEKAENCTEDGYTGDIYCSDCDALLVLGQIIPAHGHDMSEWDENGDATHSRFCQHKNGCTYTETEDCQFGEWVVTLAPACEEEGSEKRECTVCSYTETQPVAPIGHNWNDGVVSPVSTCVTKGTRTYTCLNDSKHTYTEEVEIDPDNHVGETYVQGDYAATCTTDGYTGDIHCADCDALLISGEVIPAFDHDWGEWETVIPAICEKDGLEQRICGNDASHTEENVLDALGHDYRKIDEKCVAPDYGIAGSDYYECSNDASHNYTVIVEPLVKDTFTATFITTAPFFAEDKTVGTVVFEQGDKYVSEPAVEKYDNYTFAWDEYELKDENIVIYGRYTEIEVDDVSDLETDKTASYEDGKAEITLSAEADTRNIKIVSQFVKPVDVVLVLDQSGSMKETLGEKSTQIKRDALVDCANEFVNALYENAQQTGADHRVALVGFAYSDYNGGKFANTGILVTANGKAVNYRYLNESAYQSALMPIDANGAINANIVKGINSIVADGATAADLGLEMARNIFAATPADSTRERIVLFITDGTPTSWGETSKLVRDTAAKAISEAKLLKNTQDVSVYSIGVHASADPKAAFTADKDGVKTDSRDTFKSYDFNRFLHAISSNYPNAGSMVISDMGNGNKDGGFYLAVNDTSKLNDIFTTILLSKVYSVETFDKVTFVDTLTEEFTLTYEQEMQMREKLIAENGMQNSDISVVRNADGTTTLRFENVRTQKIYNADGSSYYRAEVSFTVSADGDSLDDSGLVATNTEDAGVEIGGELVQKFDIPTVELETDRKIVVFTVNGNVYRIDEAQLGDTVVAPECDLAKWNIPADALVESAYTVFEADVVESAQYTAVWRSADHEEIQVYTFGDAIAMPEPAEKEGADFLRWTPAVPAVMPACNMIFTAVYTDEHVHKHVNVGVRGTCTDGLETVYRCACGDEYVETSEPTGHACVAAVEKTDNGSLIEQVVCTVCGTSNKQSLTYLVKYIERNRMYVLDLSLYEQDVLVQPDGTLKVRFYLGDDIDKEYNVYRIDENGKTVYTPTKEYGYLVFDADHFSFYVVAEVNPETGLPYETLTYGSTLCAFNGSHSYESIVTQPGCLEAGFTTHTCSVCADTYVDSHVEATGHSYTNKITKQPTHFEEGERTFTCHCGSVRVKPVEKLTAHVYTVTVLEEAKCKEDGVALYECACGASHTEPIYATGHHDADGDVTCDDCGAHYCDHLCHKGGFLGFIWKILRFFMKLFNCNPVCDCGAAHY